MAVTPNFSWPVPVATDYVKDGWEAISDLGNAIDTTVAGLGSGLTLVKTQTIGSAVSSVVVTDAFSADYDAYRIIVTGGVGSANTPFNMILGASTASYYSAGNGIAFAGGAFNTTKNNAATWEAGSVTTNFLNLDINLINPFLAKYSLFSGYYIAASGAEEVNGLHTVATSYTSFTISPGTGTLTGGIIRVYGYQNS